MYKPQRMSQTAIIISDFEKTFKKKYHELEHNLRLCCDFLVWAEEKLNDLEFCIKTFPEGESDIGRPYDMDYSTPEKPVKFNYFWHRFQAYKGSIINYFEFTRIPSLLHSLKHAYTKNTTIRLEFDLGFYIKLFSVMWMFSKILGGCSMDVSSKFVQLYQKNEDDSKRQLIIKLALLSFKRIHRSSYYSYEINSFFN